MSNLNLQHYKNNQFILKSNILLLFLLSFSFLHTSFAQTNFGQFINKDLPCLDKKLTIHVHWVNDSLHVDSTKTPNLIAAINQLNKAFEPICLSFEVCKIDFINYYEFDTLTLPTEFEELDKRNHEDFRLNLYIVSLLDTAACGFTTFYSMDLYEGAAIVVTKDCLEKNVIPHFVGISLGLLETADTQYGLELVNGSNCKTAGDKICDTPADPQYEAKSCDIINSKIDPNGEIYLPDISNFMSGYFGCQCKFSYQQYKLLAANYNALKKKPW